MRQGQVHGMKEALGTHPLAIAVAPTHPHHIPDLPLR